jgi:multicomponent Na+:H+ antiporter subunit D
VQTDIRKILSFHIISQIGYMIMGLALFTPLALVGAVFYIVHHIIVKTNLFLVGGVAYRLWGTTSSSASAGSTGRTRWLAVLFLIPAFSLGGLPAALRVLGEAGAHQGGPRHRAPTGS